MQVEEVDALPLHHVKVYVHLPNDAKEDITMKIVALAKTPKKVQLVCVYMYH